MNDAFRTKCDIEWITFSAMGSPCAVGYVPVPDNERTGFESEIVKWVEDFETRYSRFSPTSLISRINAQAGRDWVEVDTETAQIFALVDQAYHMTDGVFDPSALPIIRIWDYKKKHNSIPDKHDVDRAQRLVGWNRLERRSESVRLPEKGMGIDVGGICKEYAVDKIVEMAALRGIDQIIVDFGQDVRVHGGAPQTGTWRIGLDNPFQTGSCWTGLSISDGAVASSGSYHRNFIHEGKTFGHILDPRTGYPVENSCRSVTVIASTCWFAGILSTAAFVLGPDEGIRLIENNGPVEGCIITDTDCFSTKGFETYLID